MVRFFGYGRRWVSFSLSRVDDVFELRVPRLQVVRSGMVEHSGRSVDDKTLAEDDEAKKTLRREIRAWWQGVAEHLDRLVRPFDAPGCLLLKMS
jgi:1-phosphatidylinositol-3-phosphate 5-kinase